MLKTESEDRKGCAITRAWPRKREEWSIPVLLYKIRKIITVVHRVWNTSVYFPMYWEFLPLVYLNFLLVPVSIQILVYSYHVLIYRIYNLKGVGYFFPFLSKKVRIWVFVVLTIFWKYTFDFYIEGELWNQNETLGSQCLLLRYSVLNC